MGSLNFSSLLFQIYGGENLIKKPSFTNSRIGKVECTAEHHKSKKHFFAEVQMPEGDR